LNGSFRLPLLWFFSIPTVAFLPFLSLFSPPRKRFPFLIGKVRFFFQLFRSHSCVQHSRVSPPPLFPFFLWFGTICFPLKIASLTSFRMQVHPRLRFLRTPLPGLSSTTVGASFVTGTMPRLLQDLRPHSEHDRSRAFFLFPRERRDSNPRMIPLALPILPAHPRHLVPSSATPLVGLAGLDKFKEPGILFRPCPKFKFLPPTSFSG